ncbi:hypothetical protein CR513_38188, partial [Mucuna pruriens]
MKLVLFKCDWFDNTPNIGTKVPNKYGIVEVQESRRYNKTYDPFIFAQDEQLHIDSDVINDSLADIHDGGEEMVDRGTSDSRRPSNRGRGHSIGGRGQPIINSPISTIHISTSKSIILILQWDTLTMV